MMASGAMAGFVFSGEMTFSVIVEAAPVHPDEPPADNEYCGGSDHPGDMMVATLPTGLTRSPTLSLTALGFPALLAVKFASDADVMLPAMLWAEARCASLERSINFGSATAAKIPKTTITKTNSMSVKPFALDNVALIFIFILTFVFFIRAASPLYGRRATPIVAMDGFVDERLSMAMIKRMCDDEAWKKIKNSRQLNWIAGFFWLLGAAPRMAPRF